MSAGGLTNGRRPSNIRKRLPDYDHSQGNVFEWILKATAQIREDDLVKPLALPNPFLKEYRRFK